MRRPTHQFPSRSKSDDTFAFIVLQILSIPVIFLLALYLFGKLHITLVGDQKESMQTTYEMLHEKAVAAERNGNVIQWGDLIIQLKQDNENGKDFPR